ncbi:MAG: threonine ammonia-lyase [Saprospiraceae bacterium]
MNSTHVKVDSWAISMENIYAAKMRLRGTAIQTPLQRNYHFSARYNCNIFLKREDLQVVRSYKIRGAFNKIATLTQEELDRGVVCASAGNHAQGVAFACKALGTNGRIYMPSVTPRQKVHKVKLFGEDHVEVILTGDTFDDAHQAALEAQKLEGRAFIHPFDDHRVIEGQGTVGLEVLEDLNEPVDYVFVPVGGGGLASGLGSCVKQISPRTKVVGVEPTGAAAMHAAFQAGKVVELDNIDSFVDGAAVRRVGEQTFRICRKVLNGIVLVPEGKVCTAILQLYNEEGIVVEPAGALSIAALDEYRDLIRGKNVVCVISGSNNDIARTGEIRERSLLYEGLKHYFVVRFPQRAGALREFVNEVLGPSDDITHFEYIKKNNREAGPALVGIQVQKKEDAAALMQRLTNSRMDFQSLNDNQLLFELLV